MAVADKLEPATDNLQPIKHSFEPSLSGNFPQECGMSCYDALKE
jgi:hypothetical protein